MMQKVNQIPKLPRPRELTIKIDRRKNSRSLSYEDTTHEIFLPNMKRYCLILHGEKPRECDIDFRIFVQSISHEIMHKILHEFVGFRAMLMWDFLDKQELGKEKIEYYVLSCL